MNHGTQKTEGPAKSAMKEAVANQKNKALHAWGMA
jgi:hypothetical protein